ncbi:MAG: DUF3871 family protein [Bacteroidetes bacterium]|nr:DUF3871 family protein [Bacteroidota bacterium]MDA0879572.1 DUF3871 family protein [Bacteroidota bacterium]MDA1115647.1 DUF3871 family protein [Bacteroidota bacterium]
MPALIFNDIQLTDELKDYFLHESFARNANGDIDLWKMYNLFTGANKSSYIDLFLQRGLKSSKVKYFTFRYRISQKWFQGCLYPRR